jgi:hypothetical protein
MTAATTTNAQRLFRLVRCSREMTELPASNPSTYFRWATVGRLNSRTRTRHVLRTRKIGGALCTCRAWLEEFFDALSERPGKPTAPTPRKRLHDVEKAERQLQCRGM